ncbi:hypothetical protein OAM14_00465 [Candidatus Pelagibacter sp.]|nr:hypothetical protein [Candidatus Pelagibacter sp.]
MAINYIINLNIKAKVNEVNCLSCNFYSKNLNKENFFSFYRKFNSRIKLKEKYDLRTLKKKSSKDACFKSYILFSKFLIKNREINNIQKLNTILKVNDLLILKFQKRKHFHLIKYFKKNNQYEKKLLNLYL